ncbi:hypothetical protein A2U01_0112158, partial [Trifolium medium]|nr:hypothetical protein [Trifolium medium]
KGSLDRGGPENLEARP